MVQKFKFADMVIARIAQIVQEAMLTGVDCVDLLRNMTVVPDSTDPHVLVMPPEYLQQVRAEHERLVQEARNLQTARHDPRFVINDPSTKAPTQ